MNGLPSSLPAFLRSRARALGPKPALVVSGPKESATWTFADLWTEIRRQAIDLLDRGLSPRRPVLLIGRPSPETLLTELALQAIQCIAIRLSPEIAADRLADGARAADVALVLYRDLDPPRVEALRRDLPEVPVLPLVDPPPPKGVALERTVDPRLDELAPSGPDGPAVAVLPEGSADLVLARLLIQRNLVGLGDRVGRELGGTEEDLWWIPIPGYGAAPYVAGLAPAWLSGGIVGLTPDVPDPLEAIWRLRPSVAVLRPQDAVRLARRLVEEISGAAGWNGRLARWALRMARSGDRASPLLALLEALVGPPGRSVLRTLIGERLDRAIVLGEFPEVPMHTFAAFRVTTFLARGPLVASELWTLDRLPLQEPGGELVPGTDVRLDPQGRLEVKGISASRRLHLKTWRAPERTEDWQPTYCPGSLSGRRLVWSPPMAPSGTRPTETL